MNKVDVLSTYLDILYYSIPKLFLTVFFICSSFSFKTLKLEYPRFKITLLFYIWSKINVAVSKIAQTSKTYIIKKQQNIESKQGFSEDFKRPYKRE